MASSKKTTASLFNNMSSLGNKVDENIESKNEPEKEAPTKSNAILDQIEESKIPVVKNIETDIKEEIKETALAKADKANAGKKTVSFTTPGEIKDKLQRYSIAFPESISQYITDLIIKDFNENEEKYEEIATLLEKVKGLR